MIYDGHDFDAVKRWVCRQACEVLRTDPDRRELQIAKWWVLERAMLDPGKHDDVKNVETELVRLETYRASDVTLRRAVTRFRWYLRHLLRQNGRGLVYGSIDVKPVTEFGCVKHWIVGGRLGFFNAESA